MLGKLKDYPILAITILALLIRVVWFLAIALHNPDGIFQYDSFIYVHLANIWNELGQFSYHHPELNQTLPAHSQLPLYPMLIALSDGLGLYSAGLIVIQILLSTATVWIVMKAFSALTTKKAAIAGSGLIMALDIPSIVFANLVMTESLFTFLIVFGFWQLMRAWNSAAWTPWILSGLSFSLVALTKAVGLVFPIVAILLLLMHRSQRVKAKQLVAFSAVLAVLLGSWVVRNYLLFDRVFYSTLGNVHLYEFRAAGVVARENNLGLSEARRLLDREVDITNEKGTPEELNLKRSHALSVILEHPGAFLANHFRGMAKLLFSPTRQPIQMQFGWAESELSVTGNVPSADGFWVKLASNSSTFTSVMLVFQMLSLLMVWVLFLFGVVTLWKSDQRWFLLLAGGFIICFCMLASGPETSARYRLPLMPLIAMVAAVGVRKIKLAKGGE